MFVLWHFSLRDSAIVSYQKEDKSYLVHLSMDRESRDRSCLFRRTSACFTLHCTTKSNP